MTTILNLTLLLVGTAATLAAFGGKTWREGSEPILERITVRGWVSLICLILALGLGTTKEFETSADEANRKRTEELNRTKAELAQTQLKSELQLSKAELDIANERLKSISNSGEATQEQLKDAKERLLQVRTDLSTTRDDLTEQSTANLVTAFSNANKNVKYVRIAIPLTPEALGGDTVRQVLLPRTGMTDCESLPIVDVYVQTPWNIYEHVIYKTSDDAKWHRHLDEDVPKIDAVNSMSDTGIYDYVYKGDAPSLSRYPKFEGKHAVYPTPVYSLALKPKKGTITAAQAYSFFSDRNRNFVYIRGYWPDSADPVPDRCAADIRNYFKVAFEKALVIVEFDDLQRESIVFRLKALTPVLIDFSKKENGVLKTDPMYIENFKLFGQPEFITNNVDDSLAKYWGMDAPSTEKK